MKVTAFRSKPRTVCIDPNCSTNQEPEVVVGACPTCAGAASRPSSWRGGTRARSSALLRARTSTNARRAIRFRSTAPCRLPTRCAESCGAPMVVVTTNRGPWKLCPNFDCPRVPREEARKAEAAAAKAAAAQEKKDRRQEDGVEEGRG